MDESQPIPDGTPQPPERLEPVDPPPFWEEAEEKDTDVAGPFSSPQLEEWDLHKDRAAGFDLKLFLWLSLACAVATVGMIPYTISLLKQAKEDLFPAIFMPLVLVISAIIEIGISVGAIAIGLGTGRRFSWGVPPLSAWLAGNAEAVNRVRRSLLPALIAGMALGVVVAIFAGDHHANAPDEANEIVIPPAWEGLLASLSAGIREEIWFRLGCMTFFAWVGTVLARPFRKESLEPPASVVWIANVLAALLFAAIHLPQAQLLLGLSPGILLFVVLGNGIPGMIFGWFYWRHGLIASMVAHFGFDLVLKVFIPLLF
jgi:membrane protease YdiL (CAAX protease family)